MTAPRQRRKPVAPVAALPDACRYQLLTGCDHFGCGFGRDPTGAALDRMRADWQTHRDELLAEWIAEHPGTRPFAWWQFDSVGRRETIDGSVHPFDRPERRELCRRWHAAHSGMRHDERFVELFFGVPVICVEWVRYESERAYLARLNLLTPDELESSP